jgi:ubiquinone biosynthesis protein
MSIVGSAQKATRVVKNVGRLKEIVTAMARFGLGTLVSKLGLSKFVLPFSAKADAATSLTLPQRIRGLCEELGPTFIKIGQVLAGRPDLIPQDFVDELLKLQDRTRAIPFLEMKPTIEKELKKPLESLFSSFDTEPLATASIAQVHVARTHAGDEVVVKVQKPGVERVLTQDLEILELLVEALETAIPEIRPFRPRMILDEFKRSLLNETDFTSEARNVETYARNFKDDDFLVIPRVFKELSSERVLTLERLKGIKLNEILYRPQSEIDTTQILQKGMDRFFKSLMLDGFFHADPHAGNIFILPDGRMGLVDFGLVGRLSKKARMSVINMFLALVSEDYVSLVWEYIKLSPGTGFSRSSTRVEAIAGEVEKLYSPYHGLGIDEIPAAKLLMQATGVAFRHEIRIPTDLVLMFKAIMTLEGLGRKLDPQFDLVQAATKYSRHLLLEKLDYKSWVKDFLFFTRDFLEFSQKAPRQLGEVLRQMESGEFRVQLKVEEFERYTRAQTQGASRIALALLAGGLMLSAAYVAQTDTLPGWAQGLLWAAASGATAWSFWKNMSRV